MKISRYRKGIIAAAGFLAVLAKVLGDAEVTADEVLLLLEAFVVAYGVYRVPNAK